VGWELGAGSFWLGVAGWEFLAGSNWPEVAGWDLRAGDCKLGNMS